MTMESPENRLVYRLDDLILYIVNDRGGFLDSLHHFIVRIAISLALSGIFLYCLLHP